MDANATDRTTYAPTVEGNKRTWTGQRILVAIGILRDGTVLGYEGGGVDGFMTEGTEAWSDVGEAFPHAGYPDQAGIYVWSGDIWLEWEERGYTLGCDGKFTAATASEIAELMGKQQPPLRDMCGFDPEQD